MVVLGSVFLALPLAAWGLLTRTRLIGWTIAATLLGCGAGWLLISTGHIDSDSRANAAMMLTVLTPLLMVAGLLAEWKFCVRRPRGSGTLTAGGMLLAVSIAANLWLLYGLAIVAGGGFTPG